MMKRRLILLRHAKSAWDTDAATDHARPLNKRGRRDAPRIGQRLAELGWAPELVLSSDATRTRQTWDGLRGAFERPKVCFLPGFYGAGVAAVREELGRVAVDVGTVMAIGHNPGWEEVLEHLGGRPARLTTANAALLEIEAASWPEALSLAGRWRLETILRPKEL